MTRLGVPARWLIITSTNGAGWVQAFPSIITDQTALAYVLAWLNPVPAEWSAWATSRKPDMIGTNPETWNPAGWIWDHTAFALVVVVIADHLRRALTGNEHPTR